MEEEFVKEILSKCILHWNYRSLNELPKELESHGSHIQEIYFKWNNISSLPSWIEKLQHLSNLYLQHNQINQLPASLGNLKLLSVLDISHNFVDVIPPAIGKLKFLTEFLATHNNIRDLPNDIAMLQSLEKLDLSSNLLSRLPVSVCECLALQELFLDNNKITSLPEKIVYLPLLTVLSVCSNRLLYLPMLPFVSSPCLCLNDNPHLNYVPVAIACQVTANSPLNVYEGIWELKTHGCFLQFGALTGINHQIVVEQESDIIKNEFFLVIPKSLTRMSSSKCRMDVPTLNEISMRLVYSFVYQHKLEINTVNGLTFSKMRRVSSGFKPFSVLPVKLQNYLMNGPVSLCHFPQCQKPIFTFGTIWIIPQSSISKDENDITSILSTIMFCSVGCSTKFAEWETGKLSILGTLRERKLNWYNLLSDKKKPKNEKNYNF